MRGFGLCPRILTTFAWAVVVGVWGWAGAGCGDPPLCQSEVFVAFQEASIAVDVDAAAPGVQTDVHIRTSLEAGDLVTLEILSEDGTSLATLTEPAAADGSVVFSAVSVSAPRVVLRATGRGTCGEGHDEITVDVPAGAGCTVQLVPEPEVNAYYAPFGVLSTQSDPDPVTPGYQTTVRVTTSPGWNVEIWETTAGERSLGVVTAGADGVATLPVTVLDGQVGFRATCRGTATELASPTTTLVVDTTPPGCAIVAPMPGSTITSAFDDNHTLGDGVQLAIAAHADGGDVAGEPVTLTIGAGSGAPIVVAASDTDADGTSTAAAVLDPAVTPATFDFELVMRDHAGNTCTSPVSYDVVYNGCDIAVVSPLAPVTSDADGSSANGSQVDVTLAVAPACVGRTVTSACGMNSPSGVVAANGRVTLRVDICATSPCRVEATCTFGVSTASGVATQVGSLIVFDDRPRVASLTAAALDRQHIQLGWTAPASSAPEVARYVLKSAQAPLTDATFDAAAVLGIVGAGVPGSPQRFEVVPARTGTTQYFAIATLDAAGHRSAVSSAGPIVPAFDQTGAIRPINAAQGALALGSAIVHGKFNDDEFDDLAIAAPGQNAGGQNRSGAVYVYFGGPLGIAATPDLTITGTGANANFGAGLTAVRWSRATRDDLVIGAPGANGGAGQIFVFRGGAGFAAGTRASTTADLQISVSATQPGWFARGRLGSVLATADIDGDGTVDLVAAAPRGGNTSGGAVILYGGTVTGSVVLSTLDASGANGAIAELFADPSPQRNHQLGFYLHAVGPTLGALDATDDLVIAYADDHNTVGDSLFVLRGNGTRPASPGVTMRPFVAGRDVRLDFATSSSITEWGSQVASIDDQNGDGARELVIGAYRAQNDSGQVLIVSGNVIGTGGVARTSDPGVTLTTINAASGVKRLGAVIAAHDQASHADIDGDGRQDLLLGGLSGATAKGFVWFGGTIASGAITTASAPYAIVAPSTFAFQQQNPVGAVGQARWIGDINQDGLDDLCWASPFDNANAGDGSFEVLWDAR